MDADIKNFISNCIVSTIVYENGETPKISWDNETTVESIVCMARD